MQYVCQDLCVLFTACNSFSRHVTVLFFQSRPERDKRSPQLSFHIETNGNAFSCRCLLANEYNYGRPRRRVRGSCMDVCRSSQWMKNICPRVVIEAMLVCDARRGVPEGRGGGRPGLVPGGPERREGGLLPGQLCPTRPVTSLFLNCCVLKGMSCARTLK